MDRTSGNFWSRRYPCRRSYATEPGFPHARVCGPGSVTKNIKHGYLPRFRLGHQEESFLARRKSIAFIPIILHAKFSYYHT